MPQVQAQRRLVKSPPELWSELSDAEALARHLGEFGEIRITRLEPETKVVWEGERVGGSVEIEASGWGTKVVLTVDVESEEPEPEPAVEPAPEPEPGPEPVPEREPAAAAPASVAAQRRRGFLARFFAWDDRVETTIERAHEAVAVEQPPPTEAPEPEPTPEPKPAPEPNTDDRATGNGQRATNEQGATSNEQRVLENVLDALGQAHHRPFSRA